MIQFWFPPTVYCPDPLAPNKSYSRCRDRSVLPSPACWWKKPAQECIGERCGPVLFSWRCHPGHLTLRTGIVELLRGGYVITVVGAGIAWSIDLMWVFPEPSLENKPVMFQLQRRPSNQTFTNSSTYLHLQMANQSQWEELHVFILGITHFH